VILWRRCTALITLALLGACAQLIPRTSPVIPGPLPSPPTVVQTSALLAGVRAGPSISSLGIGSYDAAGALASFRESCPRLVARTDTSGLTRQSDWQLACEAARTWPAGQAQRFFEQHFETAQVADGQAFATGYYEPEISGVRQRQAGFDVPVYRLPPDLVRGWPDTTPADQRTGTPPLGRTDESGHFVPYFDRAAIEDGALMGRGLEIAWAADPVEFYFLQVQGSGPVSYTHLRAHETM
jgi:membrane-bound lytic murein transglycosylase A